MYLLYADGSGSTKMNRDRTNDGLYVLSGVIVHDNGLKTLEKDIAALKRDAIPRLDPGEWELHAHEIWNNRGVFKKADIGIDVPKKLDIFDKTVSLVCSSDATLLNVVILKDLIRSRRLGSKLADLSWTFMAERFEHFLACAPGTAKGVIFMDSSYKESESEIRNTIHRMVRHGTPRQRIERVMDEPVFVSSDRHLLVQLADVIAYITNRHYKGDPKFERWFEMLVSKTYRHFGKVRDFGLKEFPSREWFRTDAERHSPTTERLPG